MQGTILKSLFVVISAASTGAAPAQQHAISQKNRQFSPQALTVKVGESVTFTNDDNVYHNVFSLSKPLSFDLGAMPPGRSGKVQMAREGVIEVECAIHPDMKLEIKVVK